jgi:hypothetical protein
LLPFIGSNSVDLYVVTEGTVHLDDKVAAAIGAGQSPGEGIGNGRATVAALRLGGRAEGRYG